jgi:hypothetical protein
MTRIYAAVICTTCCMFAYMDHDWLMRGRGHVTQAEADIGYDTFRAMVAALS